MDKDSIIKEVETDEVAQDNIQEGHEPGGGGGISHTDVEEGSPLMWKILGVIVAIVAVFAFGIVLGLIKTS